MGGCGSSTAVPLCPSFLLILFPGSSVGPPRRLKLFRINLLLHGPFAPWLQFLQAVSTCSSVGSSTAVVWVSALARFSTGCREIPTPPLSLPCAADISALAPCSFSPFFFSDLGVHRVVSLTLPPPHSAVWRIALSQLRFHRGTTGLAEGLSCGCSESTGASWN